MLKPFTTKIDTKYLKALKMLSVKTRIPQSQLLKEALERLFEQYKQEQLNPEFMKLVNETIDQDREALKRLA